jgi:hypothetical protein
VYTGALPGAGRTLNARFFKLHIESQAGLQSHDILSHNKVDE